MKKEIITTVTGAVIKGCNRALDFIFPPRCLVSNETVERQGLIAPHIWSKLRFIGAPICKICGVPFDYDIADDTICAHCLEFPPHYDSARSALVYDDHSKGLILGFKHADQTYAVIAFLPWLKAAGAELLNDADILIPVPLHRWRLLKRRYNQAAILAQYLGRACDIDVDVMALKRVKSTKVQGHLSPKERKRNVKKAFAVRDQSMDAVKGKRVILIDDVYTSGATANECARILKSQGSAAQVHILTIAKVVKD